MMVVYHELKTLTEYFQAVLDKKKTFEIRLNDREFKVGDFLILKEFTGTDYTDKRITAKVTYMLDAKPYVPDGYVCMSIKIMESNV